MPMKFFQIGEQNGTIISRLEVISGTFIVISQSPPPSTSARGEIIDRLKQQTLDVWKIFVQPSVKSNEPRRALLYLKWIYVAMLRKILQSLYKRFVVP